MIDLVEASSPSLVDALTKHPKISNAILLPEDELGMDGVRFCQGSWVRYVGRTPPTQPVHGLIELMDNNPMVCADRVSVPSPLGTLALIGLGPLTLAGLLLEPPLILSNVEDEAQMFDDLGSIELDEYSFQGFPVEFEGVLTANIMARIAVPSHPDEIDDLYNERYSKSFFVRRDEESPWDVSLVAGKPWACYRLRLSPDASGEEAILTIQTMADANGKCGDAQILHALNVMAGFEESAGIA
jgi:hypothetical protein